MSDDRTTDGGDGALGERFATRRTVLGAAVGGGLVGAFGDDAVSIGRRLLTDGPAVSVEERGQAHPPALELVSPEEATHVATTSGR